MINLASYHRPRSLEDALDLLSSDEFMPIAGGTDLIPQLRRGQATRLLDVSLLGLDFIREVAGSIEIGASVTHSKLMEDPTIRQNLPLLAEACGLIGSVQIRNRGTIGGNIVNASPCADTVPVLLNFEAEVVLLSRGGKRNVKLDEFVIGPYSTVRKHNELLHSIKCRPVSGHVGFSYVKLGRRRAVNISRMTLAANIVSDGDGLIRDARLSGGSVFPVPSRMREVENLLAGQRASENLFQEAGKLAADLMIAESGRRWSTPYKMPVLTGLVERALAQAVGFGADIE